jgi:tetratricopeptide (TPR) repeat protein
VHRALLSSLVALSIAAPLHQSLSSQQPSVVQAGRPSEASMAMLPMASSSAAAKMHAMLGQRALETNRPAEAAQHFQQALAADSTSAFAQLGAANATTSFAEYDAALSAAARLAEHASLAERLQVDIARKSLVNDFAAAEVSARELVSAEPKNPRSYLALASVQSQMGREAEARRTLERAIAVAPNFALTYRQLAYSYMTAQPTDPSKAGPHVAKLVALEPTEVQSFITQGSYFRATNQLPLARTAYSRAALLDSTMAFPLQQRGHAASFLGDYDAARADYDAAIKLGKQNEAGSYLVFRALVAAHAGNPKQAIAELDSIVTRVDQMGLPDPLSAKIGALDAETQIATQIGDFASAAHAIAQRTPLVRQQVAGASDTMVKKIAEADIAFYDGMLAARQGDSATANAKAAEIRSILAATRDPRKNQRSHAILGVLALEQKDFKAASDHLAAADSNDPYIMYEHALALDGAGRSAEAKALFKQISQFNFNGATVPVARREAAKRLQ